MGSHSITLVARPPQLAAGGPNVNHPAPEQHVVNALVLHPHMRSVRVAALPSNWHCRGRFAMRDSHGKAAPCIFVHSKLRPSNATGGVAFHRRVHDGICRPL